MTERFDNHGAAALQDLRNSLMREVMKAFDCSYEAVSYYEQYPENEQRSHIFRQVLFRLLGEDYQKTIVGSDGLRHGAERPAKTEIEKVTAHESREVTPEELRSIGIPDKHLHVQQEQAPTIDLAKEFLFERERER